jgi:hypothetical protein
MLDHEDRGVMFFQNMTFSGLYGVISQGTAVVIVYHNSALKEE